jgi:hypothetical protein
MFEEDMPEYSINNPVNKSKREKINIGLFFMERSRPKGFRINLLLLYQRLLK